MKKIYLLLLIFSGAVQSQIINFPDANFKAKLLEASVGNAIAGNRVIDVNGNGEIEQSEALSINSLSIPSSNISDVTGISAFSNLGLLNVSNNNISQFAELNSLTNLYELVVSNNPLTSINMAALSQLRLYDGENTSISSLDFTGLQQMISIYCNENHSLTSLTAKDLPDLAEIKINNCEQLLTLDLSGSNLFGIAGEIVIIASCPALQTLNISNSSINALILIGLNNLVTLNASNCRFLERLSLVGPALVNVNVTGSAFIDLTLQQGKFISLDLTGLNELENLDVSGGLLNSLDLSGTRTSNVNCSNNPIVFLNIKNGDAIATLNIDNTPLLEYVCSDDSEIIYVTSVAGSETVVGTYCTFTPGGDYNTITGTVRYDENNNGCDALDAIIPFYIRMNVNDTSIINGTVVNETGNYTFYTLAGNYNLNPQLENPDYYNISPTSVAVNFPLLDNSIQVYDFCVAPNGTHVDVEVVLVPIINPRPGIDVVYKIIYRNKGNQTVSGALNLVFDNLKMDFISSDPIAGTPNSSSLTWNYSELLPFEMREIEVIFKIHRPNEINPVVAGDALLFTTTVSPVIGDEMPSDNTFNLNQIVVNSHDPNDKTCLEGINISPEYIGKYLHYNINFENIGTADAVNIVVKDTINTAKFDINSLQVLYTSHPAKIKITGNIVEFVFENINLPPSIRNPIGGHGNVLFKIRTNPNLTVGDTVENTANIYFDYNAPIVTNEAKTTFRLLKNQEFERDNSVRIHPNPVKDFVKIHSKNTIKSIDLFDVQGRILQTSVENKKETSIDLSQQSNGIYFLKINTEKGSKIEKIIKK